MERIDLEKILRDAENHAMESAKVSYPSDVDFFGPIQRFIDEEKPEKLTGVELVDLELQEEAVTSYVALRDAKRNWRMDAAIKEAYPKKTAKAIREEGVGAFTPLEGKCRLFLKDNLEQFEYKAFTAAFRFWEQRHTKFVNLLPEKLRRIYDDMLEDEHLRKLYMARWGFQRTTFTINYISLKIFETAELDADGLTSSIICHREKAN